MIARDQLEEDDGDFGIDFNQIRDMCPKLPVKRVIDSVPSVTERYFEPRYYVPDNEVLKAASKAAAGDQCVMFHSNR